MDNPRRSFLRKSALLGISSLGLFKTAQGRDEAQFHPQVPKPTLKPKVLDKTSDLKIKSIETFVGPRRNQGIVRVTTDDGSAGWGQVANYSCDITVTVLHRLVARQILGKDPYQTETIINDAIERQLKYPWSFVSRAGAGIETALWDLRGRIEGKPVCELLGGEHKPIPVYGSSMRRDITPKAELERLKRLRGEMGYEFFKIRVGKENGRDVDQWEGRSEAIVSTVGKGLAGQAGLLADANSGFSVKRAIEIGKQMQDNGFIQFEEPCPYWEYEQAAEVTKALDLQVSGGEQDNDPAKWRRMIAMRAFDMVQPDICYLGGISRTIRVAEMAEAAGLTCVPHSANLSLITVFSAHLLNALNNAGPYLEYSIENPAFVRDLYNPGLSIKEGKLIFPEGPGWGLEINRDWFQRADYHKSE